MYTANLLLVETVALIFYIFYLNKVTCIEILGVVNAIAAHAIKIRLIWNRRRKEEKEGQGIRL